MSDFLYFKEHIVLILFCFPQNVEPCLKKLNSMYKIQRGRGHSTGNFIGNKIFPYFRLQILALFASFDDNHWECKFIYHSMSYPLRSLLISKVSKTCFLVVMKYWCHLYSHRTFYSGGDYAAGYSVPSIK